MENKSNKRAAFAVWVTGLPASGKSTICAALKEQFAAMDVDVAVLESDVLRRIFALQPQYDRASRDAFYRQMIWVGKLLVDHGVPVVFDATASRRGYRDEARERFARFLEVYVDTPLEVCMARDPKGIYRSAREGTAANVPGLQTPYEPPIAPELIVDGIDEKAAALGIVQKLKEARYV